MGAKKAKEPVDKAVADINRATNRLIDLLTGQDESIGSRAVAALAALDPPPIWALSDALLKEPDATSRLGIIRALTGMGVVEPFRVVIALSEAVKAEKDLEVKKATFDAMVSVRMKIVDARGGGTGGDARPTPRRRSGKKTPGIPIGRAGPAR